MRKMLFKGASGVVAAMALASAAQALPLATPVASNAYITFGGEPVG